MTEHEARTGDKTMHGEKILSGVELIAAERQRQIQSEGWTPEHDDAYQADELSRAAIAYCEPPRFRSRTRPHPMWPWDAAWWKPSEDRVRELAKAGALIAAEIDRLQRKTQA